MAIFTAETFGESIERCLLNRRDTTRLVTCANIFNITLSDIPPPVGVVIEATLRGLKYRRNENGANGVVVGKGWVDILDTTDEGYPYFIVDDDGKPTTTRYYGVVELEWASLNG